MSNITIILTTTINIDPNIVCVVQTDKNKRLGSYLKAITQWLDNTNFNIILVENSGYIFKELEEYQQKYNDRFEIFSYKECKLDEKKAKYLKNVISKGAHEIVSINYAFNNSKIIKPSHFIIKIT